MPKRDLVIVGSAGMLGRALVEACAQRGIDAVPVDGPKDLDVTDETAVTRLVGDLAPAIVVNATGYTDVDAAESDDAAALAVNRDGALHLARACALGGSLLVQYSTDYVFDGRAQRPYRVDDAPNPINAYGRSKLAGERAVAASGCRHVLVRTSWLFAPWGRNFVRTILDLARRQPRIDVVDDQRGRPTYAPDLAAMTLDLLDRDPPAVSIVHAANDGDGTWYELAAAVVELTGLPCDVRPCPTAMQRRPAARPPYSVLDLSDCLGRPRHWRQALAECLARSGRVAVPRGDRIEP